MNAPAHTAAYDAIEAINWSTLVHLATSPRMLQWRREHPRTETPALVLGTAIHCAALEPDRWRAQYVVQPRFDRRTKIGKLAYQAWLAEHLERDEPAIVIDEETHATAERCAAAVRAHSAASELLRGGRVEEPLVWLDEETGLRCKGRLDFITPAFVLDLKSTRHSTIFAMARDAASRLYHGQLAFYHDGATAKRRIPGDETPRIILVQTTEPYDVVPARLAPEDLERGRGLYRSLLRTYAQCQAAGWWPGLAPSLIDLPLPAWAPAGDAPTEEEDW